MATIAFNSVEASPIPVTEAVSNYVPLNKRTYTAEEIGQHEKILKRSSFGFNDWSCKPSAAHPRPVVLVHGLIGNGWDNWLYMGPRFAVRGYCVFSLTYGTLPGIPLFAGLDKMENSALQLSTFIDKVLAATNTTKVNLVGHSQGSLMPRYYLKYLGGAPKIDKYAAFGPIAYGTTLDGLIPFITALGLYDSVKSVIEPYCYSCFEFLVGSDFLTNLNADGDTVPGVQYRFIASKTDEVVTPYTNGFLRDKNPLVQDVVLQNLCAVDLSEHVAVMADPIVFHEVDAFFDPTAPQTVNCLSALY
ncbi:secreted lipase [Dissophora ornata]|nr:secreted lipase [Dissophora ornata]